MTFLESRVFSWGANSHGEVGNGAESTLELNPVEITHNLPITPIVAIDARDHVTLIIFGLASHHVLIVIFIIIIMIMLGEFILYDNSISFKRDGVDGFGQIQ